MPFVFLRPLPSVALGLLLAALGCADHVTRAQTAGIDDFGTPVLAGSEQAPGRIVSLNPTTTELLFRLSAGHRLVGRTTWDLHPDSARFVPDLGPGLRPNVEAVLARRPDLVVLYGSEDNRAAAAQLRRSGVQVIALKIDLISQFARAARLLGVSIGRSAAAESIVVDVERELARVRTATTGLARPRVAWHVWHEPLIVIGSGSYLDELMEIAGGDNVYGDLPQPSPQVSLEDLMRRDPDVVLASPEARASILRDGRWSQVRAVRTGRVLAVDTALVGRPSVRLGEAAWSLALLLHPGLKR